MQPKNEFNENIGDTVRDENELFRKELENEKKEEDSDDCKVIKTGFVDFVRRMIHGTNRLLLKFNFVGGR
jgi:hypothetical protein